MSEAAVWGPSHLTSLQLAFSAQLVPGQVAPIADPGLPAACSGEECPMRIGAPEPAGLSRGPWCLLHPGCPALGLSIDRELRLRAAIPATTLTLPRLPGFMQITRRHRLNHRKHASRGPGRTVLPARPVRCAPQGGWMEVGKFPSVWIPAFIGGTMPLDS